MTKSAKKINVGQSGSRSRRGLPKLWLTIPAAVVVASTAGFFVIRRIVTTK